jgi:quercetin dioxygenase-like cupin family protein
MDYILPVNNYENEKAEQLRQEKRKSIEIWCKPLSVQEVQPGDDANFQSSYYDDVVSSISLVSNMWVKQMVFEQAGDVHPGHAHTFDHQTLLARGSVEVNANGQKTIFTAPTIIYIKAGIKHGMVAMEDKTVVYCLHPLRDGEHVEDIIDPKSIPNGVMPLMESMPKQLIPVDKV